MMNRISELIDEVIAEINCSTIEDIVMLVMNVLYNSKDSYIALSDADEDVNDRVCELDEHIGEDEQLRNEVINTMNERLDI
jgi:hypothetical protein